jgi:hypothetical protein
MLRACPHFLLARACNSISLRPVRGREREREKDRERKRGRERERGDRGGESVRKREREKERENMFALFLFLKGMTGALAPFGYLVYHNKLECHCKSLKP